jgi:hypothetical protein
MSPISRAKIFDLLEKKLFEFTHFSGHFHPFKSETDLCQNRFPLSPFRKKPPQGILDKRLEGRSVLDLKGWGKRLEMAAEM